MRINIPILALFTGVAVVVTACPGDREPEGPYVDDDPPRAEELPQERRAYTVDLVAADQPGFPAIAGSATLTALTVDETEISIFLEEAPEDAVLPVALYRNGCGRGATSVWPLGRVPIDPDGQGIHTETVPEPLDEVLDLLESEHYIQVRDEDGDPLACGPTGTWERRPTPTGTARERGDPFPPPAEREDAVDPD